MRSGFLQRAARRVVGGYPKPWRERYDGEVLSLLDDSPARWRDVLDLGRGQVVERVRSMFEPGDRPTLATALVALAGSARAGAIVALPLMAGWIVRSSFGPAPRSVSLVTALLNLAVCIAVMRLVIRAYPSKPVMFALFKPILSRRARRRWTGLLLVTSFLVSWAMPSFILLAVSLALGPVGQILMPNRKQLVMALARHNLRSAQHDMTWAAMELQRCERLDANGLPAPIALEEARAEVDQLTRQRDDALATLHGLGYRARLRTPTPNPEPRTLNPEP